MVRGPMGEEKEDGASAATIPWTMMSALEERVRAHDEDDEKKKTTMALSHVLALFLSFKGISRT